MTTSLDLGGSTNAYIPAFSALISVSDGIVRRSGLQTSNRDSDYAGYGDGSWQITG